jgi:hypothetical protein
MFEASRDRPMTDRERRRTTMTAKITSPQKKQIERLMADALGKTNTTKDGGQRLIERGDKFMAYIMAGVTCFTAKAPDFGLAREILGLDFISPEEIAAARGLTYSAEQVAELERTLPNKETLEWLKRSDYYLVAGSPHEMSLLDVHELECDYFYSKEGAWYAESSIAFARNEKVTCRWYMLCKDIVPNSTFKTWDEQKKLLSDPETAPTAVDLIWMLTCYKAVRDRCLLGHLHARTSSVGSLGRHVVVGRFSWDGLRVDSWSDSQCFAVLGLSAARKAL